MMTDKTARIRALNDRLRRTLHDGLIVLSAGVHETEPGFRRKAVYALMTFDDFTKDNDPYDEHDFGAFDVDQRRLFFKIDYYADGSLTAGSEDPSDPSLCLRVLTLMLAEEY